MGTDRYKATSMNRLSLNYRVETMSEEMKELLDEIYVLSRSGKFSIEVGEIDKDDIDLLRALGYKVEFEDIYEYRVTMNTLSFKEGDSFYI